VQRRCSCHHAPKPVDEPARRRFGRAVAGQRVVCASDQAKRTVPPSLSVVIPVLNGERFIGRCLEHLRRELRKGDEIVVVDNGSRDRTLEIARAAADIKVLVVPRATIAGVRNRGAAVATNDVLAFLDADCLVQPGWRASIERILSDPGVSATGSYCDVPEAASWIERAWWSSRPKHEHRASFLISGNFVIRKKVFDRIGGFDETLITDEDTDISERLVSTGAVLIEAPSVRVIHLGSPKTFVGFFRKEKWHATSITARAIDRPMLLTFVFVATCTLAALVVPLGLRGWRAVAAMMILIMIAPTITATYNVAKHGNYRYFFQLLPLYFVVYLARTLVLVQQGLRRPWRR
jgi:GT2 family glycosyltransferase